MRPAAIDEGEADCGLMDIFPFQHGEDRLPHPGSIDGNKFLWTGDGDANHIHLESHANTLAEKPNPRTAMLHSL
jgi:hypothetical protein